MEDKRKIAIKDAYLEMITAIGYDYDGWNDVDHLKKLIDELCEYAARALRNDDITPMYSDGSNVLLEGGVEDEKE